MIYTRRKLKSFSQNKYNKALNNINMFLSCINSDLWSKKLVLDIGFGSGEVTYHRLQNENDISIIACEVFLSGIIKLSNLLPNNERLYIYDNMVEKILPYITNESIYEILILFPDPWHKKRHHKRRMINEQFVYELYRISQKNIIIATDNEDYFNQIRKYMSKYFHFSYIGDKIRNWPKTKYAYKACNRSYYMVWTK